ncbi:hypothetical protein CALCODRAFT_493594 [Calocera cornea HHB12733]|uniref:Uncharacterized protein n=1 Tax=Calocera cornea HHB12733 TaxID=1353952 RepID=A0A165HLT0_9BASI|nr:hypothetical protein CALCODRAFT_493594 [Calocera cornea HHB12733]
MRLRKPRQGLCGRRRGRNCLQCDTRTLALALAALHYIIAILLDCLDLDNFHISGRIERNTPPPARQKGTRN